MVALRMLHFVFKDPNRSQTARFYREILGMKILRHEEFSEGCEAACNGPYANRWSKTMVGYGPEETHFVLELTYNYGITHYDHGNDFIGVTIESKETLDRAAKANWPVKEEAGIKYLEAPGGYRFFIIEKPQPTSSDPILKVSLACSDLKQTLSYWNGLLNMKIVERSDKKGLINYRDSKTNLEFVQISEPVNHAAAYGRMAFSIPYAEQEGLEKKIKDANKTILTPLLSLDTPGKATVRVLILADPDGHEICFVDGESFKELSQFDPNADAELDKYIKSDKSRS